MIFFFYLTPKHKWQKQNKHTGLPQTKKLLHGKENQQNERQPMGWEKIFITNISDRGQ